MKIWIGIRTAQQLGKSMEDEIRILSVAKAALPT